MGYSHDTPFICWVSLLIGLKRTAGHHREYVVNTLGINLVV